MSSATPLGAASSAFHDVSTRAADRLVDADRLATVFDETRRLLALVSVALTFVLVPYWISIHTLLPLWRRLGRGLTVATHVAVAASLLDPLLRRREEILSSFGGDLGRPAPHALACGAFLVLLSGYLKLQWMRAMPLPVSLGWRGELERGGEGGRLITTGPYAVVRHPRYAQVALGASGVALVSHHGAAWFSLAALAALLVIVSLEEEQELRRRFDRAYDEYCAAVPTRWFPLPFAPLPERLRVRAEKEARDRRKGKMPVDRTDSDDAQVERAFADDVAEDAVPSSSRGGGVSLPKAPPDARHEPRGGKKTRSDDDDDDDAEEAPKDVEDE